MSSRRPSKAILVVGVDGRSVGIEDLRDVSLADSLKKGLPDVSLADSLKKGLPDVSLPDSLKKDLPDVSLPDSLPPWLLVTLVH